jgi:hypothetical protein
MTITAQTSLSGPYAGNGSTDVFAYAFKILDEDHLVVTLADSSGTETVQTITTHYTVSGVGDAGGGNVTMVTPPATGETLSISRSVPKTQETDLANRGSLSPEVLETALDKLTQIAQDYDRDFDRTILTAVTSGITGLEMPTATADMIIGWNSTADGLKNYSPNASGYIGITASTDNAMVRYDGTSGRSFQNSGVIVDDSDNVTGIADLTITGDFAVTGVVEASNGTVSLPGVAFASDLDSGMYRVGANNVGFAVNGARVFDISASGLLLGSGARITQILDEDDMASDSATAGITQQSAKAYIDAQVAAGQALLHLQDQKSSGTDGGTFTSGDWQTRTLNTEVTDEIGSTLSSDQFTLPAGTYWIEASAPATNVNAHKLALYNVSDTAYVLYGVNCGTNGAPEPTAHLHGRFTIADTKTFELRHRCGTTRATDGFGLAASFSVIEIYADVRVWKVS